MRRLISDNKSMRIFSFFILPVLLAALAAPIQGQPVKKWAKSAAAKTAERKTERAAQASRAAGALKTTAHPAAKAGADAADQALQAALKKAAAAAKRRATWQTTKQMTRSVFFIQPHAPFYTVGTGFVFEIAYNGKTEVWGVVASHVAQAVKPFFFATFFKDGKPHHYRAEIVLHGHFNAADAALVRFESNEDFFQTVLPLQLAPSPAPVKTPHVSYAFHVDEKIEFIPGRNRKVLDASPRLLTTNYVFKPHKRKGMCGGPLLNEKQEVIGMHTGSSTEDVSNFPPPQFLPQSGQPFWPVNERGAAGAPYKRVSHAVPAARIADLVHAYHNNGVLLRPVKWNGFKIMDLNVNQSLYRVTAYRNEEKLADLEAQFPEPFLDEARLEEFVRAQNPTDLELEVETYISDEGKIYRHRVYADLERGRVIGSSD